LKVAGGESFYNAGVLGMQAQVRILVSLESTTEHTERTEPKRLFFLGDLGDLGGSPPPG
jgi:hypothetical protein